MDGQQSDEGSDTEHYRGGLCESMSFRGQHEGDDGRDYRDDPHHIQLRTHRTSLSQMIENVDQVQSEEKAYPRRERSSTV